MEPLFTLAKLNKLFVSIIQQQGLNSHQVQSYNNFLDTGLKQIMEDLFEINEHVTLNNKHDNSIKSIHCNIKFTNIRYNRPRNIFKAEDKIQTTTPNFVRKNDLSYLCEIVFDTVLTVNITHMDNTKRVDEKRIEKSSFNLPCLIKSKACHLNELSIQELINMEEDPLDIGGYVVINGKEWIGDLQESKKFNGAHIHRNIGFEREACRAEIISKPGTAYEHSSEIIIKLLTNNSIVVLLTSQSMWKTIHVPFYIFYRLFGMLKDSDIVNQITSFTSDDVLRHQLRYILHTALNIAEDPFSGIQNVVECDKLLPLFVSKALQDNVSQEVVRYYQENILHIFNELFFPHISKDASLAHIKLYYFSYIIYNILLVHLQIIPPTDRDAYSCKRMHTVGITFAKTFKSMFNLDTIQTIKKNIRNDLNQKPYNKAGIINVITSALKTPKLEKSFIKSIVTGTKELKITPTITTQNKIPSELLNRRNNLNTVAAQRTIRTSTIGASKQDARANEMRRVHPTQLGFICPIQSADTGESVGVIKQLALGAIISSNNDAMPIRQMILNDYEVVDIAKIDIADIAKNKLCLIFLNGAPIAVTHAPHLVIYRFREYRRGFEYNKTTKMFTKLNYLPINRETSFYWDIFQNTMYCWTDHGRILKSYLIVRNNTLADPVGVQHYFKEEKEFKQRLVLESKHFQMSLEDLLVNAVIEYLCPDELDNHLIAVDYTRFTENIDNELVQYTHCDVPFTNFGMAALTCPFASCNQAPRITFQTNQTKQTIGIPTLNRKHRIDKGMFYMLNCEYPLVSTVINNFIYPNGLNEMVAVLSEGFNQEDSLVINGTSNKRCLNKYVEYNYIKVILEPNEKFGMIDKNMAMQYLNANYGKLTNGFVVSKHQIIEQNDVLVSKYREINNEKKNTSEIYHGFEPIVIEDVIFNKTADGYEFCKIKYYTFRICSIGDKFSTRHGQKGIVSMSFNQSVLPFTSDGCVIDKAINTMALPARMTIGQIKEGVVSKYCAATGSFIDATFFQAPDMEKIGDGLESLGYDRWGTEYMYDGYTGQPLDNKVFFTPITYQKLPKLANKAIQGIGPFVPTSLLTRQPLDGKANDGGLRNGEMEKDVTLSAGAAFYTISKLCGDSDDFDIYVCVRCKKMATAVNLDKQKYKCEFCNPNTPQFVRIKMPWTSKNLIQHFESSGIGVKLYTSEYAV